MSRDSFIFYRSFFEAIKELPEKNQIEVYNAISEYSLNFKEVELTGISKTIFILIKPQLEANNKRFKNGSKKKQNKSKPEAKDKQNESKLEANNNDNVNDNVNVSTIVDDKAIDKVYLKVRENYKTYAAQLLNDDIFISSISREFLKTNDKNIQKATLRKYLQEYINRLDQDKKVHNNKKQFMEHFPNWLRKQEINLVKPKKEKIRYV